MAAPFPDFVTRPGEQSPQQRARQIVGHYVWLARWSEEIGNDSDLDLKKLAQLAFAHCRDFAQLTPDPVPADLQLALDRQMAEQGIDWSGRDMAAELSALRVASEALFIWVRDNFPAARTFASRTYDATGQEIETAIKVSKTGQNRTAADEVAKIRALFD